MINFSSFITDHLESASEDRCIAVGAELGLNDDQIASLPTLRRLATFMGTSIFTALLTMQIAGTIERKKETAPKLEPSHHASFHLMKLCDQLAALKQASWAKKKDEAKITGLHEKI